MPRLAQYHRHITTNRCVRCSKPPVPGKRFCDLCLKIHNTERLLLEYRRQRDGLYRECPAPATGGHIRCDRCRVASTASSKRTRRPNA